MDEHVTNTHGYPVAFQLTFGVAQLELREKFPDLVPDVKLSKHGCVRAT